MPIDRAANVAAHIRNLGDLRTATTQQVAAVVGLQSLVIQVADELLAWNTELERRIAVLEAGAMNGKPTD